MVKKRRKTNTKDKYYKVVKSHTVPVRRRRRRKKSLLDKLLSF